MKVTLTTNIGNIDNKKLGLTDTTEGSIVEVDRKKAEFLIGKGWATAHGAPAPIPEPAVRTRTTAPKFDERKPE